MEQGEIQKLLAMESVLSKLVIGQREAVETLCKALRRSRADLKDPARPIGAFMMLGPTGVGKTEIARRLAKLAEAPFLKVEATKFTEVGYVGRDVDSIIRDLVEIAIAMGFKSPHARMVSRCRSRSKLIFKVRGPLRY